MKVHFAETQERNLELLKRADEYKKWLEAMETVMKMLDEKSVFSQGKNRDEIFIFSEASPPKDESEEFYKCGERLNPPAVYKKWLDDMNNM